MLRGKRGMEAKLSARRAGAPGLASTSGGRGSRRFRQAFAQRLAFARNSGALPAESFNPVSGMRGFQPGLKVRAQVQPLGTYRQVP